MIDPPPHPQSQPQSQPRWYQLGPRSYRQLFGFLSTSQAAIAGTGATVAIGLMVGQRSLLLLLAAVLIAGASMVAAFWPLGGQTIAEWAPGHVVLAVKAVRGSLPWRSPAVGMGVIPRPDGTLDYPEALPPSLGDLEIIAVNRPGRPIGIIHDRDAGTVCACLHVRLRAFGLSAGAEQDRKLESFGTLQNDLARAGSPVKRLMLLHRTVPRRTNELIAYINEKRRHDLDSSALRALLEVIESGAQLAQEHELFLVVQLAAPTRRRRRGAARQARADEELRDQAGAAAGKQLDTIAARLREANVAVKTVHGALTPAAVARLIKDQYDPYGRLLRDRLQLAGGDDHALAPAHAWPDATDEYRDRYRADSADHVTWHIKHWPTLPVTAGFLAPFTIQADVPVKTIAIVMEPIPPVRAVREARGRRVSDRAAADTRQKVGQLTTSRDVDREQQGDRDERELAAGYSAWRWEAYVSASVAAGDDDALQHVVGEIESGCVCAGLGPVRMYAEQERAFTYTLPLCRGLR